MMNSGKVRNREKNPELVMVVSGRMVDSGEQWLITRMIGPHRYYYDYNGLLSLLNMGGRQAVKQLLFGVRKPSM